MKKVLLSLAVLMISIITFAAPEGNPIILSGSTTEHGEYVVYDVENPYFYMGDEYDVFDVVYDDPMANISVAVHGKKYIAFNDEVTVFYECNKNGFGARKIMFSSPEAMEKYSEEEFSYQTVLCKERKIDTIKAIEFIAVWMPKLK